MEAFHDGRVSEECSMGIKERLESEGDEREGWWRQRENEGEQLNRRREEKRRRLIHNTKISLR